MQQNFINYLDIFLSKLFPVIVVLYYESCINSLDGGLEKNVGSEKIVRTMLIDQIYFIGLISLNALIKNF